MGREQAQEQSESIKRDLDPAWFEDRQTSASQDTAQEAAWVTASQRGDTLAFNRLVLKWEKTVYNVALRMLQDRDEAADVTQEVFLAAFKNLRRFRQDSKFSTWLYRIAINHCITRARQRPHGTYLSLDRGHQDSAPDIQLRVHETQEGELLRSENQNRVRAALAFLLPEQQVVIELKFFQDLTFEEIATILKIPLSTIKSRLYSGLEMLKVRLGTRA